MENPFCISGGIRRTTAPPTPDGAPASTLILGLVLTFSKKERCVVRSLALVMASNLYLWFGGFCDKGMGRGEEGPIA